MKFLIAIIIFFLIMPSQLMSQDKMIEIPADELRDKIRGGLLGQILGNLNGIPHEMKYINEPGAVVGYIPSLPEGARTDDDTDFEWVYIVEMQVRNKLMLSSEEIAQLWRERINRRIWCSNQYARQLMDIGLEPPLTGNVLLNPWADFNISGQFLCETFGLLGPAMPQTASKIGLNYTRVAIDGEPAQTTQLFNTMIATAYQTQDVNKILDAGLEAVDSKSLLGPIIRDVRSWHEKYPKDWKSTRLKIKERYSQVNGAMRDRNGYELNTAATIAALLYGQGDFPATLQHAFNFGWDCDNTAATAGTILGVTKGYRWMLAQGWQIVDRYKNTTRQNMPEDETITSFADRLINLAEKVIIMQGGERNYVNGTVVYRIQQEVPGNVAALYENENLLDRMKVEHSSQILLNIASDSPKLQARGAYLAICLGLDKTLKKDRPEEWKRALRVLQDVKQVVQVLFHHSPVPAAEPLQKKAIAAGIQAPLEKKRLWE
ncbi:MAG: ADP-ribosylglycohydrolase family protein [Cyclobacteriaceae bacterium]